MIAAIQIEGADAPCVVYWTGRIRLSVKCTTWCGDTHDASDGVIQIPDDAKVCKRCTEQLKTKKPKL